MCNCYVDVDCARICYQIAALTFKNENAENATNETETKFWWAPKLSIKWLLIWLFNDNHTFFQFRSLSLRYFLYFLVEKLISVLDSCRTVVQFNKWLTNPHFTPSKAKSLQSFLCAMFWFRLSLIELREMRIIRRLVLTWLRLGLNKPKRESDEASYSWI